MEAVDWVKQIVRIVPANGIQGVVKIEFINGIEVVVSPVFVNDIQRILRMEFIKAIGGAGIISTPQLGTVLIVRAEYPATAGVFPAQFKLSLARFRTLPRKSRHHQQSQQGSDK
ncbi:hypothetical protein MYX84_12165 [Acidobacteria bacterium AH-259-O06]|nr:hypothetical protein [Acidobacteria bacterium AH-259-O06]